MAAVGRSTNGICITIPLDPTSPAGYIWTQDCTILQATFQSMWSCSSVRSEADLYRMSKMMTVPRGFGKSSSYSSPT